ncbi:HepT-like ribonuclease domain-containing protein [Sulfurihydrogenibium sp.]|uniref:HepT-like ribonuclease domain-containing protein n=1 Tax=Sulfurihydrogenibium sp. TaxID=2053621 RepID=UPI003D0CC9EE
MSKRNWKLFLVDVLESIEKIENYTSEISFEEFIKDEKTKDAVVRNIEIIGEAVKHIPEEIKEKYNEIPWKKITGMRNRLIHGYFVIDYTIVWKIIKNELPDLKEKVKIILGKEV